MRGEHVWSNVIVANVWGSPPHARGAPPEANEGVHD